MGRRIHLCECLDCYEKYGFNGPEDSKIMRGNFHSPPYFYIEMQHFTKKELISHIEETVCPNCGSENWSLKDYSTM